MIGLATSAVSINDRCTACGACLPTCPTRALLPGPLRPIVVADRCTECLECIEVCPRDAIEVVGSVWAVTAETYVFDQRKPSVPRSEGA